MKWRQWQARIAAAAVTGAATACAIATYRTFEGVHERTTFSVLCAPVLAAGVAGFVGMIGVAILLLSRFTPVHAHDPLRMAFKACVGVTIVALPAGTAAGLEPWSWPSFAIGLVLSLVVTTGWAAFLVILIGLRAHRQGDCGERQVSR